MYVTIESKSLGNCLIVFNGMDLEIRVGTLNRAQAMALGEVLAVVKSQESNLSEDIPRRFAKVISKIYDLETGRE